MSSNLKVGMSFNGINQQICNNVGYMIGETLFNYIKKSTQDV